VVPMRATDVALTGGAVLGTAVPIWRNLSTAVSDTLVRDTDALNYTTAANAAYKMIVFQIDPALLGAYDCVYMTIGALAITESVCVEALLETRYPQATPPAAITD